MGMALLSACEVVRGVARTTSGHRQQTDRRAGKQADTDRKTDRQTDGQTAADSVDGRAEIMALDPTHTC